jgi:hypothetical protein
VRVTLLLLLLDRRLNCRVGLLLLWCLLWQLQLLWVVMPSSC